jgi:hypothetical protein
MTAYSGTTREKADCWSCNDEAVHWPETGACAREELAVSEEARRAAVQLFNWRPRNKSEAAGHR